MTNPTLRTIRERFTDLRSLSLPADRERAHLLHLHGLLQTLRESEAARLWAGRTSTTARKLAREIEAAHKSACQRDGEG